LAVLFWQSCPGDSSPNDPVLAILSWLLVLTVLFWFTYAAYPILPVPFWLLWLSFTGCPTLAVLSWLFCPACPVLVVW
jgi:hypothetical protein